MFFLFKALMCICPCKATVEFIIYLVFQGNIEILFPKVQATIFT